MATIRAYTTIEQSKKLAEILPLESADMYYMNGTKHVMVIPNYETDFFNLQKDDIPCWSFAALLDVLPDEVGDNHYLTLDKEGEEYCCCYEDNNGNSFRHTFADNPVDACYEMIIRLHEQNLL